MESLWNYTSHDAKFPFRIELGYEIVNAVRGMHKVLMGIELVISEYTEPLDWGFGRHNKCFARYSPLGWQFFINGSFQSNFNSSGHKFEESIPKRICHYAMMNVYPYAHQQEAMYERNYQDKKLWAEVQEQAERFFSVAYIMSC